MSGTGSKEITIPDDLITDQGYIIGKSGKNMKAIYRVTGVHINVTSEKLLLNYSLEDKSLETYYLEKATRMIDDVFEEVRKKKIKDPTDRFARQRPKKFNTHCDFCARIPHLLDPPLSIFQRGNERFQLCLKCAQKMAFSRRCNS